MTNFDIINFSVLRVWEQTKPQSNTMSTYMYFTYYRLKYVPFLPPINFSLNISTWDSTSDAKANITSSICNGPEILHIIWASLNISSSQDSSKHVSTNHQTTTNLKFLMNTYSVWIVCVRVMSWFIETTPKPHNSLSLSRNVYDDRDGKKRVKRRWWQWDIPYGQWRAPLGLMARNLYSNFSSEPNAKQ